MRGDLVPLRDRVAALPTARTIENNCMTNDRYNFTFPVSDVQTALSTPEDQWVCREDEMIVVVYEQLMLRSREIPVGVEGTAEIICGREFWDGLHDGVRFAGKCMRALVRDKEVPFAVVKTKHEYPVRYRRIPG